MTEYYYDTFNCNTHAEEIYSTDPTELAEVNQLMVAPESEWDGYEEWSAELEESDAWTGAVSVETPNGEILIKPECERIGLHKDCLIYKCERAMRLDGIDL